MSLGESLIAQMVWKACDHGGDREKGEGVDWRRDERTVHYYFVAHFKIDGFSPGGEIFPFEMVLKCGEVWFPIMRDYPASKFLDFVQLLFVFVKVMVPYWTAVI